MAFKASGSFSWEDAMTPVAQRPSSEIKLYFFFFGGWQKVSRILIGPKCLMIEQCIALIHISLSIYIYIYIHTVYSVYDTSLV